LTKTRLPPTWIVLLPALALAAVGVRAVMAEMRASQDAARDRARSVASRLARSVDALVDEYAAPLPKAGAEIRAIDAPDLLAHLQPHHAFDELRTTSVRREGPDEKGVTRIHRMIDAPTRPALGVDKDFSADAALVRDARRSARRLSAEPGGAEAAAALLAGVATVLDRTASRWPVRLAQAMYESAAGAPDAAIETIAAAVKLRSEVVEFDGERYPEAALVTVAELLRRSDPPDWFVESYEFCANHPSIVDDDALDRVDRALGKEFENRMRPTRRLAKTAQSFADTDGGEGVSATIATLDRGRLRISIWRSARSQNGGGLILLGGEIPQSVVEDRIGKEVAALAAEPGVATVRLANGAGEHAFDTSGNAKDAKNLVVDTVSLADSLATWRAEAVVAPESGVPATAWLLAAAVVVMTGALLWGAVALRRAAERSARLAEDRRTFLDHVAHELRTPAAAVQALSEELASGHVAAEKEPEYRRHLLRESRRLAGLVDDTLDFARLDAGRLAFKTAPADLRDVVRRAIEESDGAGRVVAKLPDEPVVRDVDAAALRRAVKNLVENAAKHGGGDASIDVALEAGNGHASIVVADRGRGIAPEHLPRIFERFWRAPSATHETKGVGLGLALCREIARAHGGDVEVASEVGKGSTFTLRMPNA
jgi:signal transduction histidine kinase